MRKISGIENENKKIYSGSQTSKTMEVILHDQNETVII